MKLILNCHSTNEFGEGCDYAFLDLTPELASEILRRKDVWDNLHASDRDLGELVFWDCSAKYFSRENLPEHREDEYEALTDVPHDEPFKRIEVVDGELIEHLQDRTECDLMVIYEDSVWWRCYPKHCDYRVDTHPIDYDTVRAAAMEVAEIAG